MRKPELNPSNYKQVYEYYADKPINQPLTKFAHFLFSLMYKPQISIDKATNERISSQVSSGGRIIIAANHVNNQDQYVLGSLIRNIDSLKPLIGNITIPAKAELFNNQLMRFGLDNVGALPTFRRADQAEISEYAENDHMLATKALIDISVKRMLSGQHLAIFPEGTRNTKNPKRLNKIKSGVSRIALRTSEVVPVSIVPLGIHYPEDDPKQVKVWVDKTIDSPFGDIGTLRSNLESRLQHSVDNAHEMT